MYIFGKNFLLSDVKIQTYNQITNLMIYNHILTNIIDNRFRIFLLYDENVLILLLKFKYHHILVYLLNFSLFVILLYLIVNLMHCQN